MTQTVSGFTVPAGSDPVSSIDDTLVTFAGEVRAAITAATEIPSQTGNSGKYLNTDGSASSWQTVDAVPQTLIDAKGDLIVGTADNTAARLPVGSNGQILVADSTQTAGVKWGAPAGGGGLVFIAGTSWSGSAGQSLNNCFSSTYENYRIVGRIKAASGSPTAHFRLRASGTDNSSSNYHSLYNYWSIAGTGDGTIRASASAQFILNTSASNGYIHFSIDVYSPFAAVETQMSTIGSEIYSSNFYASHGAGVFNGTTSFDGVTFFASGTNSTGEVRVYGYANS